MSQAPPMTRPARGALLFSVLFLPLLAFAQNQRAASVEASAMEAPPPAKEPVGKLGGGIPYNDPAHIHFFRYQRYLLKKKLEGLAEESWEKLPAEERLNKLALGEAFLKKRFLPRI